MRRVPRVLVVWIVRTLGARGACNVLVLNVFFGWSIAKTIKTL